MNQNTLNTKTEARVLFIDMNSFFASCEQQTNYWLRGRPIAVCVYTGKYGCVIAPSIEAKKRGIQVVVDGAHSFAQLDFRIDELNGDDG